MRQMKRIFTMMLVIVFGLTVTIVIPNERVEAYSTLNYNPTVYITTENVNVRSGPGTSYSSYGILPVNTVIAEGQQKGKSGNWTKFRIWSGGTEKIGYIESSYIKSTSSNRLYQAKSNVNIRKGPGTSYSTIVTVPKGSGQLLFYGYKISADGYEWVADCYCDANQRIGSSSYYICSKGWTAIQCYK